MATQVKHFDIDVVYFNTFAVLVFCGIQLGDPSSGEQSEQCGLPRIVQTKENYAGVLLKKPQLP